MFKSLICNFASANFRKTVFQQRENTFVVVINRKAYYLNYFLRFNNFNLKSKLFEEMSSGRGSRKRGVVVGGEGDPAADLNKKKTTTRSARKPVKIEVEEEENTVTVVKEEAETTSKYFLEQKKQGEENEVKIEQETEEIEKTTEDEKKTVKKSKSPSKKTPVKVEPPPKWETIMENIKIMRSSKTAAVDTMGCERTADLNEDPKVQRFQLLVSLMLSSQTKDQVTFAAMERLKARATGLNVQAMLDIDETELGELLKPVGFFRRKSTYIKKTAAVLRESYDDDIPKTIEDLCSLQGVGPKMAYICMNAAWGENVGIGVDTHVHRISNRLKWTGKGGTSTPEKTREALESWMPKEHWQEFNILLVGFGQETCLPIGPKCDSCLNKSICPSSTAKKSKSKK